MSFVPAPHPPEFRQRAVDLARSKVKTVAEIAKDLSIAESCLRNWLAQAVSANGLSCRSVDDLTCRWPGRDHDTAAGTLDSARSLSR
jgi:hypothetical protein